MNVCLPLPHFESEGLKDGYRQHDEGGTDETGADGFLVTSIHIAGKSNIFLSNRQTAHHFSTISSLFHARLSLNCAEYPRILEDKGIRHTFASEILKESSKKNVCEEKKF
jgi:hypothetical protein